MILHILTIADCVCSYNQISRFQLAQAARPICRGPAGGHGRALTRFVLRSNDVVSIRKDVLITSLLKVIDAQDRLVQEAGLAPVPRPGVVEAMQTTKTDAPELSRTAQALCKAIAPLAIVPTAEQDQALALQVGLSNLAPLHFGMLYCGLGLSIGQVSALVKRSKSVVYRSLVLLGKALETLDLYPPAQTFSGVLGLDEKWVKIPKSFSKEDQAAGKKWRYAHFAVDALTGDIIHVDIFDTSDAVNARAFLVAIRAMGIRPKTVVTDMWAGYESVIRETFGPHVIHHYCLFHHLQAVRARLQEYCGKQWNQSPLLRELVQNVDHIYDCGDVRTAKDRLQKVLAMRPRLEASHPEAVPLLDVLEKRFPKVSNALGNQSIPTTNNVTERVIKAFNRHYKRMAGLESIPTARDQLALFRFFYRLTPQRERVKKEERGKCPLELAGFKIRGTPLGDYVRSTTESLADRKAQLLAA